MVCDENGSSLGYGYIHFETEEAARTAIEKVNGMFLNGKQLLLGRFRSRQERLEILGDKMKKFNNLYIKNFGKEMTEDEMNEMFQPYGKLISVKIMSDIDGKSRRFGFVSYEKPEAAEKAVEELDGSEVNLANNHYFFSQSRRFADRHEEKKP